MHLQQGKHSDVLTPEQSSSKSALPGHEPPIRYLLLWHKTSPGCHMAVRCTGVTGSCLFLAARHFYLPHHVFLVYTSFPNVPQGVKCLPLGSEPRSRRMMERKFLLAPPYSHNLQETLPASQVFLKASLAIRGRITFKGRQQVREAKKVGGC